MNIDCSTLLAIEIFSAFSILPQVIWLHHAGEVTPFLLLYTHGSDPLHRLLFIASTRPRFQ